MTDELKDIVEQFKKSEKTIQRVTIYRGSNVDLHLILTKKDGNVHVLYSISGKNPRNSFSFADDMIDEAIETLNRLKEKEELREFVRSYERENPRKNPSISLL